MFREAYIAVNYLLILILGLVVCSIQSVLFKTTLFGWLEIDLVLLIVVYMGLHRSPWEGAVLSLLLSRLVEIHSGAPAGLLGFVYEMTFLSIYLIRNAFLVGTSFSGMLLAMTGGFLFKVNFLLINFFTGTLANVWKGTLTSFIPYVLILGLLSKPCFQFLLWLDSWTTLRELSGSKRMVGEDF